MTQIFRRFDTRAVGVITEFLCKIPKARGGFCHYEIPVLYNRRLTEEMHL